MGGLLMSQTQKQQFVEALKAAREGGWHDDMIARALKTNVRSIELLVTGFAQPTNRQVLSLSALLQNSPPKSVLPPLPRPSNGKTTTEGKPPAPLFVGDSGGAPRQTKERTNMETSAAINGVDHDGKNSKKRLLPKSEAKALHLAMEKALESVFEGDLHKMAEKMGMTPNGLRKAITRRKGSFSEFTRDQFIRVTGWSPESASAADNSKPPQKKTKNSSHLSPHDRKQFREAVMKEAKELGSLSRVAFAIGVDPGTLSLLKRGKGSTYKTRDLFNKYVATKEPAKSTSGTNGMASHPRPTPKLEAPPMDDFDLFTIAGHLLAAGKKEEAYFISIVARAARHVSIETLTETLASLLPPAGGG